MRRGRDKVRKLLEGRKRIISGGTEVNMCRLMIVVEDS